MCVFGRYKKFSSYIEEYGKTRKGHGLDIGAGPGGCNSKFFIECESLDGCDA